MGVLERRNASRWTQIHPVFAIGQLGVFLTSLALLGLYAFHLVPFAAVALSVLIKIAFMVGAVITGSLWEHDVYGRWWFANEFFIEDVMTANVFALHIAYLIAYYAYPQSLTPALWMLGVAYAVYGINVAQYVASHMKMTRGDDTVQTKKGLAA